MSSKNYSDMASTEKLTEKLLSLESRLEALGYIPTQKEDRSLYANVKYYRIASEIPPGLFLCGGVSQSRGYRSTVSSLRRLA